MLKETGALYELNKKGGLKIKAPRSEKYGKIVKPLREEKKQQKLEELET